MKGIALTTTTFLDGRVTLHGGDNRDVLKGFADCSIHSIVTDPPYALVSIAKRYSGEKPVSNMHDKDRGDIKALQYKRLAKGFMGKDWDTGETAFSEVFWAECYRVLKPGGLCFGFSGTRTYHRMACAIEDAGFEIRDMLSWLYGSGFPKSHNLSKAIDKAAGAAREKVKVGAATLKNPPNMLGGVHNGANDRPWREEAMARGYHEKDGDDPVTPEAIEWNGWGTALKPALEPICMGRKPLIGTVVANVLEHRTGALNIDGCRVGDQEMQTTRSDGVMVSGNLAMAGGNPASIAAGTKVGRWPANVMHDGSAEVVGMFPDTGGGTGGIIGDKSNPGFLDDGGSAARFFYSAKADSDDRIASKHPTVKPVALMQWLCRLVTPPKGIVLDPFAGSGSTGEAAWREGFSAILIEREVEYQGDIARRMELCLAGPEEKQHAMTKARGELLDTSALPLFGGEAANDNQPRGRGRKVYGHFADQGEAPPRADGRNRTKRAIGPTGMA